MTLDPKHREAWVVNNDGGGVDVFSYDQHGDVKPIRELDVPHQSWGLSLDMGREEIAVTSQQYQGISIYSRTATGAARPLRTIRGENTQLADPHGVYLDGAEQRGVHREPRQLDGDAVVRRRRGAAAGRVQAGTVRAAVDSHLPRRREWQRAADRGPSRARARSWRGRWAST